MKKKFTVKIKQNPEITVYEDTTLLEISQDYKSDFKYPIILSKVNNELMELHKTVRPGDIIEFLDMSDPNGFRAYQRSLSFVMIYAIKDLFGKKTKITIEHSIKKNYFCEIQDEHIVADKATLEKIEKRMKEVIAEDLPIAKYSLEIEDAISLCKEFNLTDKIKLLKFRRTSSVNFYQLDWFYNYFYGQLVSHTGVLNKFKLIPQMGGFLLQFPDSDNPDEIQEAKVFEKISRVFRESSAWAKILNIDTVGSLNEAICRGELSDIIKISEGLHEKKIASIADMIHMENKRLVMIAGPSSSGKTTFSHRLATQLRVNGLSTHIISMDDYFKNQYIKMEDDSDYDFEALEAVDVDLLNDHLRDLLNGETVNIPHFNFVTGKREDKNRLLKILNDEIIIIEGIHGLNKKVGINIKKDNKFKIFISALTQLNVDNHNRIPTTDTRILRRIVRDSRFRKLDATVTIKMWASVTLGETKNIFPFQEDADAMFNSALIYELAVLKPFVEPILFNIEKTNPEYTEARRLIKFLDSFLGVTSEGVPRNSILREFIGGNNSSC